MRTYRYLLIAIAAIVSSCAVSFAPAALAAPPVFDATGAVITGTPAVGQTLECDAVVSSDGPITGEYVWTLGSTKSSVTTFDYVVPASAAGRTLSCTITVSDASGSATSTATVAIADGAPGISGRVTIGQAINTAPSCRLTPALPGSGAFVYGGHTTESISWTLNGVPYAQLPSPLPDDVTATCTLTVSNAYGSASETSVTKALTSVRPRRGGAPTITGTAARGATLTCTGGGFAELHGWTPTVDWLVGGAVAASGSTFVVPATATGVIGCQVTARFGALSVSSPDATTKVVLPPAVRVHTTQVKRTLPKALALGVSTMVISGTAATNCTVASTLTIPAKLAKSLGLLPKKSKAKTAVVGVRAAQPAGGAFTTTAKFTPAAKRKLASLKKLTVAHVVVTTCSGGTATTTRTVVLTTPKR